ncbi:DNA mismatch repair endonuclease MutL [Halohasta salina]|uniref:DNA mismatch repair endonuclease MutL n=1 Tax=Halohasta salina TaxID=2961621 RepID=UPI0020A2AD51|nr:DNA mismatch repair endonuclease MutL [Halohasta salina]
MTEDRPRIRALEESTVQRIAAGEVVERPASVVKELVENSLDAGASRIEVAVESGGTDRIRVSDDGRGIPESELPRAVAEHATSKISGIDDLEAGVGSLGFRGEALSTIGAVSQLTIRSRPPEAAAGAELTVEGGTVGEVRPAGCPAGTTVEVEELFFNTPARKKFLKREATEFDHVNTVVSQYALANPEVAVSLSHNGRELFGTEGSGSLRSAVLAVYGREVAESMLDIAYTADEDAPVDSIAGLVSHPETTRSTRAYLATFVNGRYVTASSLRRAVVDGYGGQLAPDRYPFAVLFVEVPPESVDVNVHPRKTEVRFDDEDAVMGLVTDAVERTLVDDGLIRSGAPRGRSAPDETRIAPEGSETETADADADREPTDDAPNRPASTADPSTAGTVDPESTADPDRTVEPTQPTAEPTETSAESATAEPVDPADEGSWTVEGVGNASADTDRTESRAETTGDPALSSDPAETSGSDSGTSDGGSTSDAGQPTPSTGAPESEPARSDTAVDRPTDRQYGFGEPTTQQTLAGGETTDRRQYDHLPELRLLGQLYDTYLLAETDSGLVLIDQHAADERVNYERLRTALDDSPSTQLLADPVSLELTAREAALFDDYSEHLAEIGFRAERDGSREIEVTAVPAAFSATLDPELLRDALLEFVDAADGGEATVETAIDELLADLACYPSITGNTSLTDGSVVDLLAALDDCENPYACPHGRPVIIEISREEIDDRFERDYPGHGGRRQE